MRLLLKQVTKGKLAAGRELLRMMKRYASVWTAGERLMIVMSEDGEIFWSDEGDA